jgi:hypothetical protein
VLIIYIIDDIYIFEIIYLIYNDDNCQYADGTHTYISLFFLLQIRPRPGDAFVFHGGLLHRGQANTGNTHRLFYYCSFSCAADENVGT